MSDKQLTDFFESDVSIPKLRGYMAEFEVGKRAFADEADVDYWQFCDVMAGRAKPGIHMRLKILYAAHKRGWDAVFMTPSRSASEPSAAM